MEWREPPVRTRRPGRGVVDYSQLADKLRRKPGDWLFVRAYEAQKPSGSRQNYLKLRLSALLGAKHVEVRSHHAEGQGELYARYLK